jgi:hypothetical protein
MTSQDSEIKKNDSIETIDEEMKNEILKKYPWQDSIPVILMLIAAVVVYYLTDDGKTCVICFLFAYAVQLQMQCNRLNYRLSLLLRILKIDK